MKIILSEEFWVLMADHNSVSLLAGNGEKVSNCDHFFQFAFILSSVFPPRLTSRYMEGQTETLGHKTAQKFSFALVSFSIFPFFLFLLLKLLFLEHVFLAKVRGCP